MFVHVFCTCLLALGVSATVRAQSTPAAAAPGARVTYDAAAVDAVDDAVFRAARSAAGLPYRLLAPAGPAPRAGYPLVLILHGSGAIGADNAAQIDALAKSWALPRVRAEFPAYVAAPQFAARTAHYKAGPDGASQSLANPPLDAALALIDELAAHHPIDRRRIYVIGFSMGASSVWHALLARPDLFAAAVPMSGVAPARARAAALRAMPLLIMHGNADTTNAPASDVAMVKALRAAGNTRTQFLMYAGLPHDIALEVVYGRWWRTWLFSQARP